MLALDATFGGIDPVAWRNLSRLLLPPPATGRQRSGAGSKIHKRPLLLFVQEGRVKQMLRPGAPSSLLAHQAELSRYAGLWQGHKSLRSLRRAAEASWLAVVEDDGLQQLARTIEGRVRPGDDLVSQALSATHGIRELLGRKVHLDPNPFGLGIPRPDQAARALDLLLPDERAFVLYVLDVHGETAPGPRVFTSLILAKKRGQISQIATHLLLGLPEPSFDLRREARQISQAVMRKVAQPHLGLYITLSAWREVVGPQPGALAKAIALGEAVLDPAPPWMIAITGLGAATGLAEGAGKLLGRFLPKGMVDLAKQVGMSPFQALGIDPLDLWNRATGMARGEE